MLSKRIKGHPLRLAVLWAITLLAYSNSFRNGLPLDSDTLVLRDGRVHELSVNSVKLIVSKDYWFGTTTSSLYRPLTTSSFLFEYTVLGYGENPMGYHIANVALHLVNIALVYCLILLLLGSSAPAFAAAGLWAVHPALTEVVTNVAGRADLLATAGVLGAMICHIRSRQAPQERKWMAGLALAAAAGLFSKENAAVVPSLMLAYDVTLGRSVKWRDRLGSYRLLAVVFGIFLILRSHVLAGVPELIVPFGDNPLAAAGFWTARLTALKVFTMELGLLVWPAKLSCDYSFNQIALFRGGLGDWPAWIGLLAGISLVGGIVISFRRCPPLCFFLVFFAGALAPTSNFAIPIGSIFAERFLYLPAVAFVAILVMAFRRATAPLPRLGVPFVVLICMTFAGRTYARNFDWYDEPTIWRSATQASPESYKPHLGLAYALAATPDVQWDGVVAEIQKALAILDPLPDERNVAAAYSGAGMCYRLTGDAAAATGTALEHYWYKEALGVLLRGRRIDAALDDAIIRKSRARGKETGHSAWLPLYLELGRVYLRLGEPEKALEALEWGNRICAMPYYAPEIDSARRALAAR